MRRRRLARPAAAAGRGVCANKVRDCDGLVSLLTDRIDAALLDAAPKLKVVSNFAVGFNNIDVAGRDRARRPRRQHARRADRRHRRHRRHAAAGRGPPARREHTRTPRRAAGRPGSRSAGSARTWSAGRSASSAWAGSAIRDRERLHHGWGMKVLYTDPLAQAGRRDGVEGHHAWTSTTLLRESDFVSVHTDLNPQTKGMFGRPTVREDEADGGVREHGPRPAGATRRRWPTALRTGRSSRPAWT